MVDSTRETDVVVIGGGPAGLAAATAAANEGADVLLVDRNVKLGGILNQCIHDGFGLHAFGKILTGPEFADHYVREALEAGVTTCTDTLVSNLSRNREIICTTSGKRSRIRAKSIVLAMGCRERTRGMIRIPGTRPAGVYTAGMAQWLTNMANIRIGQRAVILGSGDIGLIMARRLTWEGVEVCAVIEKLPYPSGLARNVTQCLEDYDIPLYLSHSVSYIHGRNRVEAVTVGKVDESGEFIRSSEFNIPCDTLLLSVGLIPENELSRQAGIQIDPATSGASVDERYMTNVEGIFSCGNVLHIHDLADWAAEEGERAGCSAAAFALGMYRSSNVAARAPISAGYGVRYVVPQFADRATQELLLSFRVTEPRDEAIICVNAGDSCLTTKQLRRAHPASMVQVSVTTDHPFDARGLEVRST